MITLAPDQHIQALALLDILNDRGVVLWAEGDGIAYRAPGGLLPSYAAQIRAHKNALLRILQHLPAPHELPPIPPPDPEDLSPPSVDELRTRLAALDWLRLCIRGQWVEGERAWVGFLERYRSSRQNLMAIDNQIVRFGQEPTP